MDKNNDQTLSPTEVLRGRYLIELEKVGHEVNRANGKIREAEHYIDNRSSINDIKGRAAFASFWIFAGVVAALGSGAGGYAGDRRENALGCLTMLAGLAAAGISYGIISKSETKDYENRWNSKIEAANIEKNAGFHRMGESNDKKSDNLISAEVLL